MHLTQLHQDQLRKSPSRNTGGGGDNNNNNQPPQKINVPKPIKDAGNTAGEVMFLKNVFELNPVGIMKNIGTKMFLDNLISERYTTRSKHDVSRCICLTMREKINY